MGFFGRVFARKPAYVEAVEALIRDSQNYKKWGLTINDLKRFSKEIDKVDNILKENSFNFSRQLKTFKASITTSRKISDYDINKLRGILAEL